MVIPTLVEPLFAVPLVSGVIQGLEYGHSKRMEVIAALQRLRAKTPSANRANRGKSSWHSGTNLFDDPDREDAIEWLKQAAYDFVSLGLARFQKPPFPSITESWAVIAGKDAWHTPHSHGQRGAWSGVIYVDAEMSVRESAQTNGDGLSGRMEILSPLSVSGAFFSVPSKIIAPKDGMILLFPCALTHFVHPNASDFERVVVSFNMFPKASI